MTRRIFLLVAVVACAGVWAAPSAQAQRDPFQPPAESGEVVPGEAAPGAQATDEPGAPPAAPQQLADTGATGGPWVALAYVLVALGLGMLALSRIARARLE